MRRSSSGCGGELGEVALPRTRLVWVVGQRWRTYLTVEG